MYPKETRELAAEAVGLGFSLSEAAELAGCSRESVRRWLSAEGARAPRAAVRLPHERKMELVARYEAGERASDLGREAGVSGCAVTSWARRLREEGVLSLMADDEVRASRARRAAIRARGAQAQVRGAGAGERDTQGHGGHTKKRPRRRPLGPDAG